MNQLICILICFLVGVLIYSLLNSYCSCNVVEGQEQVPTEQECINDLCIKYNSSFIKSRCEDNKLINYLSEYCRPKIDGICGEAKKINFACPSPTPPPPPAPPPAPPAPTIYKYNCISSTSGNKCQKSSSSSDPGVLSQSECFKDCINPTNPVGYNICCTGKNEITEIIEGECPDECECMTGYTGDNCEQCAEGFIEDNNGTHKECIPGELKDTCLNPGLETCDSNVCPYCSFYNKCIWKNSHTVCPPENGKCGKPCKITNDCKIDTNCFVCDDNTNTCQPPTLPGPLPSPTCPAKYTTGNYVPNIPSSSSTCSSGKYCAIGNDLCNKATSDPKCCDPNQTCDSAPSATCKNSTPVELSFN